MVSQRPLDSEGSGGLFYFLGGNDDYIQSKMGEILQQENRKRLADTSYRSQPRE